ncbi:MAG: hypothetical protein CL424_18400 [Acidimicrobiaceae bacterium]|nr:hypothetical protein [Acidimicrobiaceae bacterium]
MPAAINAIVRTLGPVRDGPPAAAAAIARRAFSRCRAFGVWATARFGVGNTGGDGAAPSNGSVGRGGSGVGSGGVGTAATDSVGTSGGAIRSAPSPGSDDAAGVSATAAGSMSHTDPPDGAEVPPLRARSSECGDCGGGVGRVTPLYRHPERPS